MALTQIAKVPSGEPCAPQPSSPQRRHASGKACDGCILGAARPSPWLWPYFRLWPTFLQLQTVALMYEHDMSISPSLVLPGGGEVLKQEKIPRDLVEQAKSPMKYGFQGNETRESVLIY
ncbi:hypothetical protein J6590_010874 [Homalodisca vitripennis]|nr:hypothetical protein J6590_010874 [Homalodisca vitripennis]